MMKVFSSQARVQSITRMQQEDFDLLIIGGGITGAGVARDAALRGMKVALVEASDFASGTSSRSSKLIHGGIRYLENMEFKLVYEALSERQKLFENAPHLVHPLRFMIPIYESSRYGLNMLDLGMWAYDALSLFQAPEMHEKLNYAQTMHRMPSLQSEKLKGSVVYSDAYMDDDRLVFETLRSANQAGALAVNYVKAQSVKRSQTGRIESVECKDLQSGKSFQVKARHIVSTVGPWTDEVGPILTQEWKKILRPTKGVHLTFSRNRINLPTAVVMGMEKRIVFGIPRHDMVIIGTTDTDFQGSPSEVKTSKEDVEYLLNVIHQYFPGTKITGEDILASYAGVRPLVHDGSSSEGKTSREHTIFTAADQVTFVAGGKYTTYRLMSEQIVNECLRYFGVEEKVKYNRCFTNQPLNPLVTVDSRQNDVALFEELKQISPLSHQDLELLIHRHGAEAREILSSWMGFSYWELEAAHAIHHTMCLHLVDFYTRRAPLVLGHKDHGLLFLPQIAQIFAHYLGWSQDQKTQEEQNLLAYIKSEFAWRHN